MDSQHGEGSSKHLITFEDGNSKKESSDSSFSSESAIEYKDDEKFDHTNPFLHPEQPNFGSKAPVFSAESTAHNPRNSLLGSSILSQQPNPGSYDPGRIPASVFASKPTTPMDWSVASNESLFSIHVGNNSFSRDHVFMLFKSGELATLDEYISVPPSGYPDIEPDEAERESIELGKDHEEGKFVADTKSQAQKMKISPELSIRSFPKANQLDAPRKNSPDTIPVSPEEIRISTSSVQSFHFPLLNSDMGKDASVKRGDHKQNLEKKIHQELQFQNHGTTTTTTRTKIGWFSCFTCCTLGGQ